MRFDEYEKAAAKTDRYPEEQRSTVYALGLAEEAGEFAGKIKRIYRGDGTIITPALAYELGDILWYLTRAANHIGYDLEEIACMNIHKLEQRQKKGTLKGSGDDR